MTKAGFIGLGDQGGPIARRMIDAGYETVLWARRQSTLELFKETSATYATSVQELGSAVDHCGVCVVDDTGVRHICEQLILSMKPGSLIAIHSTVSPDLCIELAQKATAAGILLVDAPVSGGGASAAAGTITVMVGGTETAVDTAMPLLKTFGKLILHLGGVGAGQKAKLINNSLLAGNISLAHQSLEAARELNLDKQAFVELIKASSGYSMGFGVAARMETPAHFKHGAELLDKDVHLLGETIGVDHPSYECIAHTALPFLHLALDKHH